MLKFTVHVANLANVCIRNSIMIIIITTYLLLILRQMIYQLCYLYKEFKTLYYVKYVLNFYLITNK